MQYQERFSETHAAEMYDAKSRELKAAKVVAILEDAFGDLGGLQLLDLGCSNGLMTRFYGEHFKAVIGIDFDKPGIEYAIAHNAAPNVRYRVGDAMDTGLPAGFELHDYTAKVVQDPVRFEATDVVTPGTFKQRFALVALRAAYWLAPTYIWVLKKTAQGDPGPTVAPTTNSSGGPGA